MPLKSKGPEFKKLDSRPKVVVDKGNRIVYYVERRLSGMTPEEMEVDLIMNGYIGELMNEYRQAIERVVAFKQRSEK